MIAARLLCLLLSFLALRPSTFGGQALAAQEESAPWPEAIRLDSGPVAFDPDGLYQGIPYAAPPVGPLRWREPRPVAPWTATRTFDEPGAICPQPGADPDETSENCLFLNVTTPAKSPDAKLPVMVFLHGGAFVSGAGSLDLYEGPALTSKGVVLVTLNYRLGALGYLAHPLLSAESPRGVSGNYGLLDQIAALKWIKANIAAFGGDPDKITVFGQSAGAESVCLLLASPEAKGLFRAAIAQSPVLVGSLRPLKNGACGVAAAEVVGERFAVALGADRAPDVLAALRRASYPEIEKASKSLEAQAALPVARMVFGPNVDGALLPDHPATLFQQGRVNAVPLLTGDVANESSVFLESMEPVVRRAGGLRAYVETLLGPEAGKRAMAVLDRDGPAQTPGEERARLERFLSAAWFRTFDDFLAESLAATGQPVRLYRYVRTPPKEVAEALAEESGAESLSAKDLGVPHGSELFPLFGALNPLFGYDEADAAFSERLAALWTNFAKTGDPNGQEPPVWPPYVPEADRRLLELGQRLTEAPRNPDPLEPIVRETWLKTLY